MRGRKQEAAPSHEPFQSRLSQLICFSIPFLHYIDKLANVSCLLQHTSKDFGNFFTFYAFIIVCFGSLIDIWNIAGSFLGNQSQSID